MTVEVTDYENRGTDDVPFGYVYFGDDFRVGYNYNKDDYEKILIWWARTNDLPSDEQFAAASAFLEETFGLPTQRHYTAEATEWERFENWALAEVLKGAALPGLYPPNADTKARYEAETKKG